MKNTRSVAPQVIEFFDTDSSTFSYLLRDPNSDSCAIIDAVLNFDYAAGEVSYENAEQIISRVRAEGWQVELLLETHIHADHLSAAPYLRSKLGGKIAISEKVVEVQHNFAKVFNAGPEFARDGSQFDILFKPDEQYSIGSLSGMAMLTPGHTPACTTHVIGDCAFVGDTLFMPDAGTARADFPGGDAAQLYRSVQRIYSLPSETKIYVCHDYQPHGRELAHLSSVAEQRESNIHINQTTEQAEFVERREKRDAELDMPRLILPAIQVNMRAGTFPPPADNDQVYLKIPVTGIQTDD